MSAGEPEEIVDRMNFVKNRLIELYMRNLVKINHSAMELVCAKHLIRYGYKVDVEKQLTDILICDVYAEKGVGAAMVEFGKGFFQPGNPLVPLSYLAAGIESRIEGYTRYANQSFLATPPVSVLPIPALFRRPPRDRRVSEIKKVKVLCDKYYKNPPVTEDEILNGRLHITYIINIDAGKVVEMDIDSYFEQVGGMLSTSMDL